MPAWEIVRTVLWFVVAVVALIVLYKLGLALIAEL